MIKCLKNSNLLLVLILGFTFCFFDFRVSVAEEAWCKYEPAIVTLRGVIVKRIVYGPPNFGEDKKTDQKIAIYVLKLNDPINVHGDKSSELNRSDFLDVKELQLYLNVSPKKYLNKSIVLEGTLEQAVTGGQYTHVLMNVQKILKNSDL